MDAELAGDAGDGADTKFMLPAELLEEFQFRDPISASCRRDGKALAANSAKAREKVASLGTAPGRDQPHKRRSVLSPPRCSISARVVGRPSS